MGRSYGRPMTGVGGSGRLLAALLRGPRRVRGLLGRGGGRRPVAAIDRSGPRRRQEHVENAPSGVAHARPTRDEHDAHGEAAGATPRHGPPRPHRGAPAARTRGRQPPVRRTAVRPTAAAEPSATAEKLRRTGPRAGDGMACACAKVVNRCTFIGCQEDLFARSQFGGAAERPK